MAIGVYLKVASANLRSAASALQSDVSRLRSETTGIERNVRQQIDDIRRQINRNNQESGSVNDSQFKSQKARENAQLNTAIADLERDLSRRKNEMQQNITNLENQAQALNREAGQLQGMAT